MATKMRAKFQVGFVQEHFYGAKDENGKPTKSQETLTMHAVCKTGGYDDTGLDEDNTFAKFSPGAKLDINIANPALWGKFEVGEKYYLDFTPAEV